VPRHERDSETADDHKQARRNDDATAEAVEMTAQELQRALERNVANALRVCDFDLDRLVIEPVPPEPGQEERGRERLLREGDLDVLRQARDRHRPIPTPGTSKQAPSAPRKVKAWFRVGRHFSLREITLPEPVELDSWGRPVR